MPGALFDRNERISLRTIERDDAEFFQRGRNHPDVRGPLGMMDPENGGQIGQTMENWVEGDESINLLVCREDEEPTPMGAVNVMKIQWDRPMVSYWLLPEFQGEGYATEAMTLLLDYFFDSRDRRGLQAHVFSHNEPSKALLERLGFTHEATLRENRFIEGAYRDEWIFGLLREEWTDE